MVWTTTLNDQRERCFSTTINRLFFMILLFSAMPFIPAEASPNRQTLQLLQTSDAERTRDILSQFKSWAESEGHQRVREWLVEPLEADQPDSSPLALLGKNSWALWWFIRHGIPGLEDELQHDEQRPGQSIIEMTNLLNALVQSYDSENLNRGLNDLLQNTFTHSELTYLSQILFSYFNNLPEDAGVSIDYHPLMVRALHSFNGSLIEFLLSHVVYDGNSEPQFFRNLITELVNNPQLWESDVSDQLEYDDVEIGHLAPTPYSPTLPSFLSGIAEVLVNHIQEDRDQFAWANQAAQAAGNFNALSWLESLGVTAPVSTTVINQPFPVPSPHIIVLNRRTGRTRGTWYSLFTRCFKQTFPS